MILITGSEATSAGVFDKLVREATDGHIPLTLLGRPTPGSSPSRRVSSADRGQVSRG